MAEWVPCSPRTAQWGALPCPAVMLHPRAPTSAQATPTPAGTSLWDQSGLGDDGWIRLLSELVWGSSFLRTRGQCHRDRMALGWPPGARGRLVPPSSREDLRTAVVSLVLK